MPWPCRLVPLPTGGASWLALRPGDMWFQDEDDDVLVYNVHHLLAPEHVGKRPLIVRLPGPVNFPIYSVPSGGGRAWTVSGEPPAVTLVPSINCHGVYHGYIRDGVVTDDIDGRTYNEDGALIRSGQR